SGHAILTENGMLFIGRAGSPVFAEDRALGDARGFPYQVLSREECAARFPQHRLDPDDCAFLDLQGGLLRPEAAIEAAAALARRHGARLISDTRVERVVERGGVVEVITPSGTLRGRRAIVAAGAWTDRVLPQAALRVQVERRVMFWFRPHERDAFTADRFPAFIRDTDDLHWYGFPTVDGTTVKLAVHGAGGEASDPDRLDRQIHPQDWDALAEKVVHCLPDLDPAPVRGQVCMYAQTEDGHFVLGFVPGSERLILLGPMLGHGFKFASAVGQIGADLATEGASRLPIEPFSPGRFTMSRDAGARA
ncbi:MAG: FAD-dependent oxidoreductase, partial [Candidatus Dormibacteraeota bacterium]|nr:FAD-dependent oxidoreductase [Candidatus Dormibacteraeota bacterium]